MYLNIGLLLFLFKLKKQQLYPNCGPLGDIPSLLSVKSNPEWGCNTASVHFWLAPAYQAVCVCDQLLQVCLTLQLHGL